MSRTFPCRSGRRSAMVVCRTGEASGTNDPDCPRRFASYYSRRAPVIMKSHVRTVVVLAVAVGLIAWFLRNVDLWRVLADILRARPEWLALSLATMLVNLSIRSLRWQFLLEPLGHISFMNSFRATAVGFAASSVLPARAGEVIRPYFLARQTKGAEGRMTATGAFATIILERLLDTVTVLVLLASFVFVFGKDLAVVNPTGFAVVKWAGVSAAVVAVAAPLGLFFLAGGPPPPRHPHSPPPHLPPLT